jgi:aspartate beta-hydroxylase
MALCLHSAALREVLRELGTERVTHSGRTLYEHLCCVEEILSAWHVSRDVRIAGMFHSIYSTDRFRAATLPLAERACLRSRIGPAAEQLVYLFAVLQREALFQYVDTCASLSADVRAELPCHWNHGVLVAVSGPDVGKLIVLHLANLIEQANKPATGIGFWLAFVSRSAARLRAMGVDLPPVLRDLGPISSRDEGKLQSLYTQALTYLEHREAARSIELLTQACSEFGVVGEPYVMLGVANRWLGHIEDARSAAEKGKGLLKRWGSPWHKRLSLGSWIGVGDRVSSASVEEIHHAVEGVFGKPESNGFASQAQTDFLAGSQVAAPSPEAAGRFFSYLRAIADSRSGWSGHWYPGLERAPWHDPRQFTVAADLQERFGEIKAEALNLSERFFHEEAEEIGRTGSWQVAMFFEQGRRNDLVCAQCPTIAGVLERHSCVRRSAGLIYLSRMGPNTHVVAHQGNSNVRLRCHLPLSIPDGDCAIRVGSDTRRWEEGKCIVFDDTFEHEVWNRTSRDRMVLLIDLWHPGLTDCERDGLEAINRLSVFRANVIAATWRRNDALNLSGR